MDLMGITLSYKMPISKDQILHDSIYIILKIRNIRWRKISDCQGLGIDRGENVRMWV